MSQKIWTHRIFICTLVLTLAVCVSQFGWSLDHPSDKEALAKARATFGDPVTWDPHVFPVGADFGVRLWFDKSERLFRMDIEPLKYLKDSGKEYNGTDSGLPESDFDQLISKLSQVKDVGTHQWNTGGYSSNGSVSWTRKYSEAYIQLSQDRTNDHPNNTILGLRVEYILPWSGKVTWKHQNEADSSGHRFDIVGMGNERFYVSPEESAKISIGMRYTFLGARATELSDGQR